MSVILLELNVGDITRTVICVVPMDTLLYVHLISVICVTLTQHTTNRHTSLIFKLLYEGGGDPGQYSGYLYTLYSETQKTVE